MNIAAQSHRCETAFKPPISLLNDSYICVKRLFFYYYNETTNEMELNSLLILLEAAEYLERRDRGISRLKKKTRQADGIIIILQPCWCLFLLFIVSYVKFERGLL